jgi:hypothetical protein
MDPYPSSKQSREEINEILTDLSGRVIACITMIVPLLVLL